MVPSQAPRASATMPGPMPPLTRSTTLPANVRSLAPDRTLLAPEDAIYQGSPPQKHSVAASRLQKDMCMTSVDNSASPSRGRRKNREQSGSRTRRRKGAWKKLLWVKQSCEYPLFDSGLCQLLMRCRS